MFLQTTTTITQIESLKLNSLTYGNLDVIEVIAHICKGKINYLIKSLRKKMKLEPSLHTIQESNLRDQKF
jgi:hypothetical protein